MSSEAVSAFGSGTAQFRSFQPFFAAFDPPSILTTGDAIALPITIRNYLDQIQSRSQIEVAPNLRLVPVAKLLCDIVVEFSMRPNESAKMQGLPRGSRSSRESTVSDLH